jgi:hypothetical protein
MKSLEAITGDSTEETVYDTSEREILAPDPI